VPVVFKERGMKIKVATIFPEMFSALEIGLLGKARQNGLIDLQVVNIRDYSKDKHKKTDDAPFGGGAGMVMTPQPLHDAINHLDSEHKAKRIYMSPKGKTLNQEIVERLAKEDELLLVCGSYEGIDERIIQLDIDEEISIGDYVLTGGELPAMVLINAVGRYVDGVLGNSESVGEESFSDGLLEYPQYTRPQTFEGMDVPEVLLGGNHAQIAKWRKNQQLKITCLRRYDLYSTYKNAAPKRGRKSKGI
jgi:tRNA (guanine37-N1)-methyltransferase